MNIADNLLHSFGKYSERIAVSNSCKALTYKELRAQSIKIALYLMQQGLHQQCITIEIQDSINHIACIAGVVLSGNYYASVTPENKPFFEKENTLPIRQIIDEQLLKNILQKDYFPGDYAMPHIAVTDKLCAFFTSSSTGASKLVVHNHKTILTQSLHDIATDNITCEDKLDLVFSVSFSASLSCIFPALLAGAGLYIFDIKENGLPALAHFWEQHQITFSTLSVSVFQGVCKVTPSLKHLAALRYVSISAEPLKDTTLAFFHEKFPATTVLNIAYATTETRTIADFEIANNSAIFIPDNLLGKPQHNKPVYIVNEEDEKQPAGTTGEIIVESDVIADGYFGQPQATQLSFRQKGNSIQYKTGDLGYFDEAGNLYYAGRKTNDVKLNGIKINLADIDNEVEKQPGIVQAIAVINRSNSNAPKLVCFYKATGKMGDGNGIKESIKNALPATHLPQFFIQLNDLPYTHSGKPDRKKLEQLEIGEWINKTNTAAVKDTTAEAYEQVIIAQFKKTLETENIDRNSDFYNSGGESLTALLCLCEIEIALKVNISAYELMDHSTPARLSEYLVLKENKESLVKVVEPDHFCSSKRDVYILNFASTNKSDQLKKVLQRQYNVIEILYDAHVKNCDSHTHHKLIEQLADTISQSSNAIVIGRSINGYIAHQLACLLPQISHCIMLDTYYYLGNWKNAPAGNIVKWFLKIVHEVFISKDYNILRFVISKKARQYFGRKPKKKMDHLNGISHFTESVRHSQTINDCIYFQANRTTFERAEHGQCWQKNTGGNFYFINLVAEHRNIVKKHTPAIARYIDEAVHKRVAPLP